MKKLMLACCFVIGAVSMSFAQGGQGGQGGGRQQMTPAARVAAMKDGLKLTDDQVTKITAIYTADAAKRDSIMKAGGDRAAMQPLRAATTAKVKALLTADQNTEFDKSFARGGGRGGQGGGRQGGGQGGAAPAPAQR